ncbi:MAG: hypothetical protein CL844_04920 [Crocinitomicaceae bacterium]|nr:hypothetical protein [Crocinitomicaceae bacterium]
MEVGRGVGKLSRVRALAPYRVPWPRWASSLLFLGGCDLLSVALAACQLHPEGGSLIAIETLLNGVPAAHGFFGFLAIADGVNQLAKGHRFGLGFPGGEVGGGGVLGAHGVLCG